MRHTITRTLCRIRSTSLPLAFIADKCGDDVAVFAGGGFSVLFDHVLALVADWRRLRRLVRLVVRLKLGPTIGAFDGREIPSTFLDDEGVEIDIAL